MDNIKNYLQCNGLDTKMVSAINKDNSFKVGTSSITCTLTLSDKAGVYLPDTAFGNNIASRLISKRTIGTLGALILPRFCADLKFKISGVDPADLACKQFIALSGLCAYSNGKKSAVTSDTTTNFNRVYLLDACKGLCGDPKYKWAITSLDKLGSLDSKSFKQLAQILIKICAIATGNSQKAIKDLFTKGAKDIFNDPKSDLLISLAKVA